MFLKKLLINQPWTQGLRNKLLINQPWTQGLQNKLLINQPWTQGLRNKLLINQPWTQGLRNSNQLHTVSDCCVPNRQSFFSCICPVSGIMS